MLSHQRERQTELNRRARSPCPVWQRKLGGSAGGNENSAASTLQLAVQTKQPTHGMIINGGEGSQQFRDEQPAEQEQAHEQPAVQEWAGSTRRHDTYQLRKLLTALHSHTHRHPRKCTTRNPSQKKNTPVSQSEHTRAQIVASK